MPGEKPIVLLLVGTGMATGMLCSQLGLKILKDTHVYMISLSIVLLTQYIMNTGESDKKSTALIYVLFLLQIQAAGASMNIQMIIISSRLTVIAPHLLATALELAFCLGSLTAAS